MSVSQSNFGAQKGCLGMAGNVEGFILMDISQTFTPAEVAQQSKWVGLVAQTINAIPILQDSYEVTTAEQNISEAAGSKRKVALDIPMPSVKFMVQMSYQDYQNFLKEYEGTGKCVGVAYIVGGKIQMPFDDIAAKYKPYAAIVNAATKGVTTLNDAFVDFMVNINHTYSFQTKQARQVDLAWDIVSELMSAVPNSVDVVPQGTLNNGTSVTIKCTLAGCLPYTGLLIGGLEKIDSNPTLAEISAVDGTNAATGIYVLTVDDGGGTPAALDPTEFVQYRIKTVSGLNVTYLSPAFKIVQDA